MESSQEQYTNVNLNIMELSKTVKNMLSRLGKFQIIVILLLCVFDSIVAINHTLTSFHTYTPHYYCRSDNSTNCPEPECKEGYQFIGDSTTIVTEWDLVCSKRLIAPLINTLYFCGVTIGAIVCGALADIWGRRKLVFGCLYIQCGLGMLLYGVGNLELFMVIRTMQGFFVQGLQGCTYTLILEYCPPNKRTAAGVLWTVFFSLGLFYLGTASYFTPDWRNLQLVIGSLSILTVVYIWFIPESVSWLLVNHKYKKAQALSLRIANINKNNNFVQEFEQIQLMEITKEVTTDIKNSQPNHSVFDIIKNITLRKRAAILTSVWFSTTMSYYTIIFYLPSLGGERHVNFVIGAAIEIVAYLLAYFILSRFGRRIPLTVYLYCIGIFCLFVVFISTYMSASATKDILIIVLTLTIKGLTVSNMCCMFIYTGELFPTTCRAASFGLCGVFSRLGSLLSPQLVILSEYTFSSLPMLAISVLVIITGSISLSLPETLNQELPNTIEEIDVKSS